MNEHPPSYKLSWKKNMISKLENISSSGLDVLADAATVSNYITDGEDKVVNTTSSHLQTHNHKTPMSIEIEHSDAERRKSLGADVPESQNSSIDTDSDNDDFGRDTSYQTNNKTTENENIPSCITLQNQTDYSSCSQPNNFLSMLMDVLSSTSMESVITWLPEGNAFIVLNEKEFSQYVLPSFFELMKFESFVKRLYSWGFKSLNYLESKNKVFYHEYFLRDYPSLCCKISQCYNSNVNNGIDWHMQKMQLNVMTRRRRSASMPMISTSNITNNAQPNATSADTLIKRFLDRKMNQIRSQYSHNPSCTMKFKRHSVGF